MSHVRSFIIELHRRSLWQVLAIYGAGSWGAYQVVTGIVQGVGLPDWVPAFTLVLFLIGLPVVLATAFVQERAPGAADLPGVPQRRELDPTLFPDAVAVPTADAVPSATLQRMLTWRRSLGAGVAAFALLALGTTGFMAMRVSGIGPVGTLLAKDLMAEGDRIILADFTGVDALTGVVTEALRIDLMQSEVVRLADPAYVQSVLRLMERDPSAGVPAEAALDLARREGLKALLVGDVSQLAGSYVLTAQLVHAETGAPLAAFKSTARDSTQLIDAVDNLSKQVRAKIGETLKSVNSSPALWRVSTASLPALRKYTDALRLQLEQGDEVRTVALIEEAIALDSTFAMAYRKLGMSLNNMGLRTADANRALIRAHELRDRLSERERLLTIGSYHSAITGDIEAAIDAYRAALALDPDDFIAGNNLPVMLWRVRRLEEAEQLFSRAVQSPTAGSTHFTNLVQIQYGLGRRADAEATLAEALRRMPGNAAVVRLQTQWLYADGDIAAADSAARARAVRFRDNRTGYVQSLFDRIDLATVRGRLREMDRLTTELRGIAQSANLAPQVLSTALRPIYTRLELMGPTATTADEMRAVLKQYPLERLKPVERPYFDLAVQFARAGDFTAADALLNEYEAAVPPDERLDPLPLKQTRLYVQLLRAPSQETIDELRRGDLGSCASCILPTLGRGYEEMGAPDSAIAQYRAYVDSPHLYRLYMDAIELPFVLGRLGELYEQQGDTAAAALYYNRLLELWRDADPELQTRVQAIRQRLGALQRRG